MNRAAADLRPFHPDDLPALQKIRAAAFAPVFASFRELVGSELGDIAFARSDAEQSVLLETLCAPGSSNEMLVATVDGEIAGFVAFSVDAGTGIGEIGLNAVHPDFAGAGIGTRMYERVLARMKALGATAAEVSTGADPSHAAARRAYAKAGFGPSIPSVTFYRRL
ncbi:MAG: N-acetyltransferase family protein [Allosphingosinicella sp.]